MGINIFLDTFFQVTDEIQWWDLIRLSYVPEGAKSLQQAADAVGIPLPEDYIGLRPFFQDFFNGELSLEIIRVHLPRRYTIVKNPSLRWRK